MCTGGCGRGRPERSGATTGIGAVKHLGGGNLEPGIEAGGGEQTRGRERSPGLGGE